MRIIHLSDIHLSQDNLNNLKNFYLEALRNDLQKFHDEKKVELLLITGDLIDKGGETFKGQNPYEIFEKEFIQPILKHLNLSKDKVLFIPGNHDIDTNEIDEIYEAGLVGKLKSVEAVNTHIEILTNSFTSSNKRIERFKEFEKNYHKETVNYYFTNNESIFVYQGDGHKIGFLLVNDSWRCSKDLKSENHCIGINQLFNAKNIFDANQTAINVVLFHHPIEFLTEVEKHEIKNILQKL